MWKKVHPVSSAGIRTHNLLIISLLLYPIDQGSRPRKGELAPMSSDYASIYCLKYKTIKLVGTPN